MKKTIVPMPIITAVRAARLKEARELAGLRSRADVERKFGWNGNTYKAHETGERRFDDEIAQRYAEALRVDVGWLLAHDIIGAGSAGAPSANSAPSGGAETVQTIPVYGRAAGGLWLDAEGENITEDFASIPACAGYPVAHQYARKVKGDSVSRRIRDGEYAIFVKIEHFDAPVPAGALVDVCRERSGLREHTVKAVHGNSLFTDNAELDQQVSIDLEHPDEGTTVTIMGVVIGAYRPLS